MRFQVLSVRLAHLQGLITLPGVERISPEPARRHSAATARNGLRRDSNGRDGDMSTQDLISKATVEPYWFRSDRDKGPRRAIHVRWPGVTRINAKEYEDVSAHRQEYWCLQWHEDPDRKPSAARTWESWSLHTNYRSALTGKAHAAFREAAQVLEERITEDEWHAALVAWHEKQVENAREKVTEAQGVLEMAQDALAMLKRVHA